MFDFGQEIRHVKSLVFYALSVLGIIVPLVHNSAHPRSTLGQSTAVIIICFQIPYQAKQYHCGIQSWLYKIREITNV